MTETITIEFTEEEEKMIAKIAEKYGQTAQEYLQALTNKMLAPENRELLDSFFRRVAQEEKSRRFDQLVAGGMEPIYAITMFMEGSLLRRSNRTGTIHFLCALTMEKHEGLIVGNVFVEKVPF